MDDTGDNPGLSLASDMEGRVKEACRTEPVTCWDLMLSLVSVRSDLNYRYPASVIQSCLLRGNTHTHLVTRSKGFCLRSKGNTQVENWVFLKYRVTHKFRRTIKI